MDANTSTFSPLQCLNHIKLDPASQDRSQIYLVLLGVLAAVYLIQDWIASSKAFKAPFVGFRSKWEPKWLVGLRFSQGAFAQVNEGYQRVCSTFTSSPDHG